MTPSPRERFAALLRAVAAPAIGRPEIGPRPAMARPFMRWRAARRGNLALWTGLDAAGTTGAAPPAEELLWAALVDPSVDVDAVLASLRGGAIRRTTADAGALMPQGLYRAIEVWTDAELSALHALAWLARRRSRADWSGTLAAALRWHLDNTQPDNATNYPWSIHLFADLGERDARAEARLFSETLLHNCRTGGGVPTPLAAEILLDAAEYLDEPLSG